jgi:hypothetical protein
MRALATSCHAVSAASTGAAELQRARDLVEDLGALDIRPGILVDGVMPGANSPPLTRAALERIARATVNGSELEDSGESTISHWLSLAVTARSTRLRPNTPNKRLPGIRERERAHLLLKGSLEPGALANLFQQMGRMGPA